MHYQPCLTGLWGRDNVGRFALTQQALDDDLATLGIARTQICQRRQQRKRFVRMLAEAALARGEAVEERRGVHIRHGGHGRAVGLQKGSQRVPIFTEAAIMVAAEAEATIGGLGDDRRAVVVVGIEGTDIEHPFASAIVGFSLGCREVLGNEGIHIKPRRRWFGCAFRRDFLGKCFKQFARDGVHLVRHGEDASATMNTALFSTFITLAIPRSRKTPNAGRVEDRLVDFNVCIRAGREALKAALDEAIILRREIDAEHQLSPIARVEADGFWPPHRGKSSADFLGFGEG